MLKINQIHKIDVLEGLKKLNDESIDCIVTSPPYWALRDYGFKDQIGLERNPYDYIDKIVEIMKECKRVLKPHGTIWINLGDSFYIKNGGERNKLFNKYGKEKYNLNSQWLQHKQRLLVPFRIAIKCQDELGLILRNDITWVKQWCNVKSKESGGTSMPSAVKDRLNTNSESLFFFVKNSKYYFNLDSVRIPHKESTIKRSRYAWVGHRNLNGNYSSHKNLLSYSKKGKNPGDCIIFPLEPSREKHYAMFPSTLPEFCIKAGCPKNGLVLDPFAGSGTTLIVSKKLGRKFIGFDLNKEYIKIATRRLQNNGK